MTHNERVLALLADGQPHSHHELYALHVIAHSRVADLRKQGHTIEQWRDGDLYLYQLTGSLEEATVLRGDSTLSTAAAASSSEHAGELAEIPSAHAAPVRARSLSGCGEGEQLTLAAA